MSSEQRKDAGNARSKPSLVKTVVCGKAPTNPSSETIMPMLNILVLMCIEPHVSEEVGSKRAFRVVGHDLTTAVRYAVSWRKEAHTSNATSKLFKEV